MTNAIVLLSIIMLVAVALLYLSNRHQLLTNSPLNKKVRLIAYLLILFSTVSMASQLSISVSIFLGLMMLMLCLMLVPFVGLFLKKEKA